MDDSIPHSQFRDGNIPSASGIYKITCIANKKIYIGSAIDLRRRRREHLSSLHRGVHKNPILQNAWTKHGEQSFTFEVLELVLPISLTAREQYWFQVLKPFGRKGFNVARVAWSNVGNKSRAGQKNTPETIEKMRQSAMGNTYNRGRKQSPEVIERKRQTHRGQKPAPQTIEAARRVNLGRKLSPEHVEQIRQSHIGKKNSPEARKKISDAMQGRKPSPQTIEAVRQANMRRKGEKRGKNTA